VGDPVSAVRRPPRGVPRLPRDDPRAGHRGGKVVTRKVFHGTHLGAFQGIEATGREVEIPVIDIVRVEGGRIVEHWNCVDRLGPLAQLGALPGAPAATGS
jgi:hypothetical protein